MSKTVSLLFGVHAHQPVGNLPEVMEAAHQRCYKPFLETVYRYPEFRFALHASGWLLEWLFTHHADDMARLVEMSRRGQVEFFGAGDMEPVLAAIPYRDRMSQLAAMSDRIEQIFGQRPRGVWLAERVWEAAVVPALVDSGIGYAMLDDDHFLRAGAEPERLNGYHSTEEDGRRLDLFPVSEALCSRLPFSPAHEALAFIESQSDETTHAAAIHFDDIEKFGIRPESFQRVYEQGWLAQFIEGVLNSPTIKSVHFRAYHDASPTRGVVYPPNVSHGGIWKTFLTRYPEANWMHKRMLGLSARLASLPADQIRQDLVELLHEAQAGDAYGHGRFGGVHLPHLRRAVWRALIGLERRLDGLQTRPAQFSGDIDMDGIDEVFLTSLSLQAVLRPDKDASLIELSSYPLAQNFADSLKRYETHDCDKTEGLIPDRRSRGWFAETWTDFDAKRPVEYSSTVAQGGAVLCMGQVGTEKDAIRVAKIYSVRDNRLTVALKSVGNGRLSTRLNLAMPSCDGPAGRYVVDGEVSGGFGQAFTWNELKALTLEDRLLGAAIRLETNRPARIKAQPHFTVSQSETGFEQIMQAVELTLTWEAEDVTEVQVRVDISSLR
ncbi:MAG: hypothetical protein B7Y41_14965 [Hydrogenophilales bacterium 28-61-23]|nr:MAG: hypothetical protein B7Y41_14965 [Hydrogenophilales bacterium 28-61-23]